MTTVRANAAACAAIVVLYAVQVWAARDSVQHGVHALHAAIMIGSGILQSAALFALRRAIVGDVLRRVTWLPAVSAAVMLALSTVCPNTDDDAAAYVGYAKQPTFGAAYAAPASHFTGNGFEVIPATWPALPALVYGPLWLAVDRALVGHAPSYAVALGTLRAFNALLLAALLLALRRLGCDRATLAVVALNPMLYFYFIVQAHNDLGPIVLVVAGAAVARTRPLLGALIASGAGLVKIVFVAIAPLAYAGRCSARRAWAIAAASAVLVAGLSWLFGGAPYVRAMAAVGHTQIATRADAAHLVATALHLAVAAIALAAIVAAVTRRVFLRAATFAFSAVSSIIYPWYLGWCIPYALRVPGFAATFFILLPALAHLIDPHFSPWPERTFALLVPYYLAVIAFVVRDVLVARRGRVSASE